MSVNLNSAAFLNQTQNDYSKKLMAETYMQIYQYAAEDFPSHPDLSNFIIDLTTWMSSVDERLTNLMSILSTHTHTIPPHVHGVIKHSVTTPTPLASLPPTNEKAIFWSPIKYPLFINTTGAVPNLTGNSISISSSSEGSALPTVRRTLPVPLTLVPKLSPVLLDVVSDVATGGAV